MSRKSSIQSIKSVSFLESSSESMKVEPNYTAKSFTNDLKKFLLKPSSPRLSLREKLINIETHIYLVWVPEYLGAYFDVVYFIILYCYMILHTSAPKCYQPVFIYIPVYLCNITYLMFVDTLSKYIKIFCFLQKIAVQLLRFETKNHFNEN
ncbi:unnamed protein product [Leptidea sinapis]|uniref:Uncharacterized protein n=1 Tax=Leptidea sinapis TaxID=189913 RepID=A0A5E4PWH3_9NEOP|nr:unnamed protein product [Leptidea sinapis]